VKLLIDTSALLALVLDDDANHAAAAAYVRRNPRVRFVTTELVLSEIATRLRVRAGAERAVAVTTDLLKSRRYEIVFTNPELMLAALGRMAQYADKRLSLTDCTSFELMERLKLPAAFSFDRDFRDCGFAMAP
jgi:uncharacterized protein